MDKTWFIGSYPTRKLVYQPVEDCIYCPVLGSFNNWNIIQFTNKTTTLEEFDAVHKVLLDGIGDNMSELVQNGKYGAIYTKYPTTMGYYVVKFLSEPYTLQDNKTVEK